MEYIAAGALTLISGVLLFIVQTLIKENRELRESKKQMDQKQQKAMSEGVLALLKIQLIEYHDKYMLGSNIPTDIYENFDEMYQAYVDLGGNGMIKRMKNDIDHLRLDN